MSFLKSYYNSVSSFLISEEDTENNEIDEKLLAENQMKESKSEGWLKGIYQGAYNQSGELWKAVKTDLTEFATVISKDAKTAVVKTAIGVKNGLVGSEDQAVEDGTVQTVDNAGNATSRIRSSINRMLDQVSKALYIPPESDDDGDGDYFCDENNGSCNRIDSRIANLQRNSKTFETDPDLSETDPNLGDFQAWKENLNLYDFQETIGELVKSNQCIFEHYAELVPSHISHDEFWSRYFYRVASINSEESRREALKLRISLDEKLANDTDPCDWDEGNDMYEQSDPLGNLDSVPNHLIEDLNMEQKNPICPSDSDITETALKFKEKGDVIIVKHSIESSSASEDNNPDIINSLDQKVDDDARWEDDIDIDVNEEDIELARNTSETDVLEDKWDDWS